MYGPNWSDPNRGVTGELIRRPANYVTVTDAEGKTQTLVGEAADAYRATSQGRRA